MLFFLGMDRTDAFLQQPSRFRRLKADVPEIEFTSCDNFICDCICGIARDNKVFTLAWESTC